ncbi:MAG TPA: hypothetical protein VKS79_01155 [Gemmataceae bacterium]|nr:hypothetical protein [Gemmataceae bacterium]
MHIAMWSGPRNISTALMRSWGNRHDAFVCDEPFYAHYLRETGLPHPGAQEVIRRHEPDWHKVVVWLTGPIPEGKTVFYQKHMAHHLLPNIDRGWMTQITHAFLIRSPREMLASLQKITPNPRLEDTGLPQQLEIFEMIQRQTGRTPPVIDARDVLEGPETMLRKLCAALNVEFTPAMLKWTAGPHPADGVWAKYWYDAVWKSTTFEPYRPRNDTLPHHLGRVLKEADAIYVKLYERRLK